MQIPSYPQIYNIGHRYITDIFDGPVTVQEKVDGSQFSFMHLEGSLYCRSKRQQIDVDHPAGMFLLAVEQVKDMKHLAEGVIYRCEYLQKPKHNALAYNRTPKKNLVLLDIETLECTYTPHNILRTEADILGIDVTPELYNGNISSMEDLKALLDRESFLGGPKIEGFVVKNYNKFGEDKKVLMGRYVSEAFKEVHCKEWKQQNPGQNAFLQNLIEQYRTETRWNKAIQHLRDDGKLTGSPKDIAPLVSEIISDVKSDSTEDIKNALFAHFWKNISRGLVKGFPEYYKDALSLSSFENMM